MRSPARALAGHLMWTRSGAVWALWRLQPLPYGFRNLKNKQSARTLHQALFRALPGESLLLSVCAGLDPAAVVERMTDGVDLDSSPAWAQECLATLDSLASIGIGQRAYWVAVPLSSDKGFREPLRAALSDVRDALGLPRSGIPAGEVARRTEQAQRLADAIPLAFQPTPATVAQLVWLQLHAQQRGLFADLSLPEDATSSELLTPRTGSALPQALLDEGGRGDLRRGDLRALNPLQRRYLKVSQPHDPTGTPASYQALLVLSDVPEVMTFPGSEFLGRVDECGLEVDWAVRLQVRGSHDALKRNRRALTNLNDQYSQREGEVSHGHHTLDRAAADLSEYAQILDRDKLEVECHSTTVFCVAGPTADDATGQARSLAAYFASAGYRLSQPVGNQEDLWWAMVPGTPPRKIVEECAQTSTSSALAAAVPLASTDLGDDRGSLLGLNISSGRPGVVLHDIAGAASRDISGSLAIAGEPGGGKALHVDTAIPTPYGWSRMGDLRAGATVFDEQGRPTEVLAVSQVLHGRACYDVVLEDGSRLTADGQHRWSTLPGPHRPPVDDGWPPRSRLLTTEQLRADVAAGQVHWIPAAEPLHLPDVALLGDPYTLGADIARRSTDRPVGPRLPVPYLRGSRRQRASLLAGLLDGMQVRDARDGGRRVDGLSEPVAADVQELLCSLGHLAVATSAPATDGGTQGRGEVPRGWAVRWPAGPSAPAGRRVVDVQPVPSVPVRCLQVAAASGLFLAGRSMVVTHNSATLKTLAGAVVDRGGRVICVDRTTLGEYATWARTITDATVVDISDPTVSLDPLRLFGPAAGGRVAQSFLTPLLSIAPTSEQGVLLSEVLDRSYLTTHQLDSLGALLRHLQEDCDAPGATGLARQMAVFARPDFGRVIFDPSLPVLTAAPAVVIRTHTLEMPSRAHLEHAHLFAQLRPETLFGRAMYAHIAALAKEICFADSRPAVFVGDESWNLTSSPEAEANITEFVRDGRKHQTAVLLGSQDPQADFGGDTLRGLIPVRILMRLRDEKLARGGLAWLDMDPDDQDLLDRVTTDTSPVGPRGVEEHRRGEGFLRDASGNIGRIKVLLPSVAERNTAVRTSPPDRPISRHPSTGGPADG